MSGLEATTSKNTRVRDRVAMSCVAALAYVLQFVASFLQPRPDYFWMTDSPGYWTNALAFFQTGRMPSMYCPMGTSLFLSPFAGAGVEPYAVVLWVHPLLHAVNAVAAFLIVRSARSTVPASIAAILVACYPPLLNYSRQLISEPWFVTTLMLGLCLIVRPGCSRAFFAGTLLGIATLVRTPGLGIALVMPMVLLILKRPTKEVLLFVVGVGVVVAAGIVVASVSEGRLVFLTSGVSMTTAVRSVLGGYEFLPENEQPASYLAHLIQSPVAFAQERLFAFLNIVSPWPLDATRTITTKLMIFVSDAPVLILCIAIVWKWMRQRRSDASMLLFVPAVGLIGFYTLLFAINRYRMPYIPPLICLAVWALWPLKRSFSDGDLAEQMNRAATGST